MFHSGLCQLYNMFFLNAISWRLLDKDWSFHVPKTEGISFPFVFFILIEDLCVV